MLNFPLCISSSPLFQYTTHLSMSTHTYTTKLKNMFTYNTVMCGASRYASLKLSQWTGTGSIKFNDETQCDFNVIWDAPPNSRGTFPLVVPSSSTPTEPVGHFRNNVFFQHYSLFDFKEKRYVLKRSSFLRFTVHELNQEEIPNSIELRDQQLDTNSTEIGKINMQLSPWGFVSTLKVELILDQQYEITHHQLPALLLYSRMQIASRNTMINTMISGCIVAILELLSVHRFIRAAKSIQSLIKNLQTPS